MRFSARTVTIRPDEEINPSDFLMEEEFAAWERLRTEKRKREWLAGKAAAKLILRELEGTAPGKTRIMKDADGKPYSVANGKIYFLSISHSGKWACASARDDGNYLFGMDVEEVRERSLCWHRDYFHECEYSPNPETATLLWTAKESLLKALGLGLSADLLDVELDFPQEALAALSWKGGKIRFAGKAAERMKAYHNPKFFLKSDRLPGGYIRTWAFGGYDE